MENWKGHLYCSIVLMLIGLSFPISGIILTLMLNNELTLDYISRYLFALAPFLVFGVIDIRYALKHKNDNFYFPKGTLPITRKNLSGLKEEDIITGNGLEDDPYKLKEGLDMIPKLTLNKIEFFFLIQQLDLGRLSIRKCRNIIVDQCRLDSIYVNFCSDLLIINNTINSFKMTYSWGNYINNNQLPAVYQKFVNFGQSRRFPYDNLIRAIISSIGTAILGYMSILSLFIYFFFIPFLLFLASLLINLLSFLKRLNAYKLSKKQPCIFLENTIY